MGVSNNQTYNEKLKMDIQRFDSLFSTIITRTSLTMVKNDRRLKHPSNYWGAYSLVGLTLRDLNHRD
jgi:hypothetical protein